MKRIIGVFMVLVMTVSVFTCNASAEIGAYEGKWRGGTDFGRGAHEYTMEVSYIGNDTFHVDFQVYRLTGAIGEAYMMFGEDFRELAGENYCEFGLEEDIEGSPGFARGILKSGDGVLYVMFDEVDLMYCEDLAYSTIVLTRDDYEEYEYFDEESDVLEDSYEYDYEDSLAYEDGDDPFYEGEYKPDYNSYIGRWTEYGGVYGESSDYLLSIADCSERGMSLSFTAYRIGDCPNAHVDAFDTDGFASFRWLSDLDDSYLSGEVFLAEDLIMVWIDKCTVYGIEGLAGEALHFHREGAGMCEGCGEFW